MAEREKNINWTLNKNLDGTYSIEAASLAVFMDLRDELRAINQRLICFGNLGLPDIQNSLRKILQSVEKRKSKKTLSKRKAK